MMFLFLLIVSEIGANLLPLPNDYSEKHSLSQCMVSALDYFIDYGEVVSIVISSLNPAKESTVPFDYILFNDISMENEISYIIKKVEMFNLHEAYTKPIAAYVIQIRRLEELVPSVKLLSKEASWNPHANFFIVSTYTMGNITLVIRNIFSIMWRYRILNVVSLLPSDVEKAYNIYTGYPEGRCGSFLNIHVIDKCRDGRFKNRDWFADKVPTDLHGCEIKVITNIIEPFVISVGQNINNRKYNAHIQFDGFEIKLMNTIAEYSNFTVNYVLSGLAENPYGDIFQNGTLTGPFSKLHRKEVDVILGYVISRPQTQQTFDVIASYFLDSLVFCAQRAKPSTNLLNLSRNLDNSVLLILVAYSFIVSFIIYCTSKIENREVVMYTGWKEILMNVFRIVIGVSVTKLPVANLNRFLLIFWIICSNWFQLLFTTILMKSLSSPHPGYQISNFEEILEDKKTIQYFSRCKYFFDMPKLSGVETILCENYLECLNKTILYDKYVTCMPKLNVQYLLHHFLDADGYPELYYFEDNVATYPIEMLMWKGHPMKPRINKLVSRLLAGGFISKWKKDVFHDLLIELKIKNFVPSERIVLKLSHLRVYFILVTVMLVVSIFVFFIECLIYKFKNNSCK